LERLIASIRLLTSRRRGRGQLTNRQLEQDQGEVVAELVGDGIVRRAQIERHHRVDLVGQAGGRIEVLVQRRGGCPRAARS